MEVRPNPMVRADSVRGWRQLNSRQNISYTDDNVADAQSEHPTADDTIPTTIATIDDATAAVRHGDAATAMRGQAAAPMRG
jgi:hypothetical protein